MYSSIIEAARGLPVKYRLSDVFLTVSSYHLPRAVCTYTYIQVLYLSTNKSHYDRLYYYKTPANAKRRTFIRGTNNMYNTINCVIIPVDRYNYNAVNVWTDVHQ